MLHDPASDVWIDEKDGSDVELCFAAWIDQNTTSFARARGEAIRILRAMVQDEGALGPPPITRVYTMIDPEAAMHRDRVAAHDLAPEAIADLNIKESGALDRLAQAERENADARDLLGRSQAQE